jgi:putative DNA primase/helicase
MELDDSIDPETLARFEAQRREQSANREQAAKANGGTRQPENYAAAINLCCASDITLRPISWLWKNWLARGKVHIIAGQPGVGKSTIAMKIAATVSAGGLWPDGSRAKQGKVIIWSGEDDDRASKHQAPI